MGRVFKALEVGLDEEWNDVKHTDGYRYFIDDNEVSREQYYAEFGKEAKEYEVRENTAA